MQTLNQDTISWAYADATSMSDASQNISRHVRVRADTDMTSARIEEACFSCSGLTIDNPNMTYFDQTRAITSAVALSLRIPDYLITNSVTTGSLYQWGSNGGISLDIGSIASQYVWNPVPKSAGERLQEILRSRIAPVFLRKRVSLSQVASLPEMRARETLRTILGEKDYRRFVRDGFVTVVGKRSSCGNKSGLVYRIYPGSKMTEVYNQGKMVERLCVVLQGEFPETDALIMRYLLILNDEKQFSSYANRHAVMNFNSDMVAGHMGIDTKKLSLPEIWGKLKKVA